MEIPKELHDLIKSYSTKYKLKYDEILNIASKIADYNQTTINKSNIKKAIEKLRIEGKLIPVNYFKHNNTGKFIKVNSESIKIENYPFEIFFHDPDIYNTHLGGQKLYVIFEPQTGLLVGDGKTKSNAIDDAIDRIDRNGGIEMIKKAIGDNPKVQIENKIRLIIKKIIKEELNKN